MNRRRLTSLVGNWKFVDRRARSSTSSRSSPSATSGPSSSPRSLALRRFLWRSSTWHRTPLYKGRSACKELERLVGQNRTPSSSSKQFMQTHARGQGRKSTWRPRRGLPFQPSGSRWARHVTIGLFECSPPARLTFSGVWHSSAQAVLPHCPNATFGPGKRDDLFMSSRVRVHFAPYQSTSALRGPPTRAGWVRGVR